MNSLKEVLINSFGGNFEHRAEEGLNNTFLLNKTAWVNGVSQNYLMHNIDPNESLKKIASENGLNSEQVQRLVEESNVTIYLKKYASTRGQKVRRVSFPLADSRKIIGEIEQVAKTYEEGDGKMEKAASYSPPGEIAFNSKEKEGHDFFTDSASNYAPKVWESEATNKTASVYLKQRLQEKQNSDAAEKAALLKEATDGLSFVASALIFNKRACQEPQTLLNKLAADAEGDSFNTMQLIVKTAADHVAKLKEMNKLPASFAMTLSLPKRANNTFSLGKHSLLKEAEEATLQTNIALPGTTDYKKLLKVVNQLNDLVGEDQTKKKDAVKGNG